MIGRFQFNGIESDDYNLVCKSIKRTLLPAVKLKRFESSNTSGVCDIDDNEYSIRTITMRITYIGTSYEELRSRARQIAAWLSTSTWATLIIHDEPDKYYLAKITNEIDLGSIWEAGEAEIEFDCQPFAYSVAEVTSVFESITGAYTCKFENLGTRLINYKSPFGSKSSITIEGSWSTLSLSMNGATITYDTAITSGKLILDNIEMEATINGSNAFNLLDGDLDKFLGIIAGDNDLVIGGTDLSIDVTVNFIPLWI